MTDRSRSHFRATPAAEIPAELLRQFEGLPPWALLAMNHKQIWAQDHGDKVCPWAVLVERDDVGFALIVLPGDDNDELFRVIATAMATFRPSAIAFLSESWGVTSNADDAMDQEFVRSLDDGSIRLETLVKEGRTEREVISLMLGVRRTASGESSIAMLPFTMLGPSVGWIGGELRVLEGGSGLKHRLVRDAMLASAEGSAELDRIADLIHVDAGPRLRTFLRAGVAFLQEQGCGVYPLRAEDVDLFEVAEGSKDGH